MVLPVTIEEQDATKTLLLNCTAVDTWKKCVARIMLLSMRHVDLSPSSRPLLDAFLQDGGSVKTWHWRWFEIDQIYLSYYRSHYHPDPIKRIPLSDILSVTYESALMFKILRCCHVMKLNCFNAFSGFIFMRRSAAHLTFELQR